MNFTTERNIRAKNYFEKTENYLQKDFDVRLRCRIVKELAGGCREKKILDIGAGDGSLSMQYQLGYNKITLVDISENMLNLAKKKLLPYAASNVRFVQSSIEEFNTNEKYDLIIGIGILAHVASVEDTIKKISCFLNDNGRCIIQISDSEQQFTKLLGKYNQILDTLFIRHGYKRNAMSLSGISRICRDNGLNIEKILRYSLLFPGMISIIPNEMLYKYHKLVKKNKILSNFGSECIIKLAKKRPEDYVK